MILGLFRRSSNEAVIERLYAAIVAASRHPALYADMGVPDTFEGRFESLTLHAALVMRRLRDSPAPGPDMAQDLIDTVFRHFDRTLREMGVGDTSVPKRMKRMAEAFMGRSATYDGAFRGGLAALEAALQRNVYVGKRDGKQLAIYAIACSDQLAITPLKSFIEGTLAFVEPPAVTEVAATAEEVGR